MPSKPVPSGLDVAGKALWRSISSGYAFRPDELAVLEDACRTKDTIAAMERAWTADGRPMTTHGSRAQLVAHPLLTELRQYRAALALLLKQLKLPDEGETDFAGIRSAKSRAAAQARWAKRG
jgi:hypothetical protein